MLLEDEGRAFLFMPFANYANYNLDACGEMIAHPDCVMGLGDGGAHVGIISDGSYPTYLLTHWGRDRAYGRFDLGWLVKRQTADTARAVGLDDRGVIAPGMKADINVIDFDKLAHRRAAHGVRSARRRQAAAARRDGLCGDDRLRRGHVSRRRSDRRVAGQARARAAGDALNALLWSSPPGAQLRVRVTHFFAASEEKLGGPDRAIRATGP